MQPWAAKAPTARSHNINYLRLYFATFTYNPREVREWVSEFRDARYPLQPSPACEIRELRTRIILALFPDNDGESPFEYELRMNVGDEFLDESRNSTRSVMAVSTLGNFQTGAVYNCKHGFWNEQGGGVRAGSAIDKAVKSGRPVPFVLAIRSAVSGREVASWRDTPDFMAGNSWSLE